MEGCSIFWRLMILIGHKRYLNFDIYELQCFKMWALDVVVFRANVATLWTKNLGSNKRGAINIILFLKICRHLGMKTQVKSRFRG